MGGDEHTGICITIQKGETSKSSGKKDVLTKPKKSCFEIIKAI